MISVISTKPLFSSIGTEKIVVTPFLASYTDQVAASEGYITANITLRVGRSDDLWFWVKEGLGRHIVVLNPNGMVRWEGFIDQISCEFGRLSFSRGPLMDACNRVQVKYTDFTVGQAAITTAQNDTNSQAFYGIIHKVISTGSISSTTADSIRATYLQENKLPASSSVINSQLAANSLTLSCRGYGAWLSYPYTEATDTTYTLREKVLEVLGDDPNGIFSTNYNNIEANTLSVFRKEDGYREASVVIADLVAMGGDSNNNRRLFRIGPDRVCSLAEIPSTIEYTLNIDTGALETANGGGLEAWQLQPGKWLYLVGLLPGHEGSTNLRDDPRAVFIESVNYTWPNTYSINGSKTGTLTQQLAKLGLGSL